MSRYAEATKVSVAKSRSEIDQILTRYGASQFLYGRDDLENKEVVMFRANGRHVKFVLELPDRSDEEFWYTPAMRNRRSEDAAYQAWEQACRQRWRALALVIKAKLEAVEAGITCFEDEFMAHIMLPDGQTVGQWMRPQLEATYESGRMPKLLPAAAGEGL